MTCSRIEKRMLRNFVLHRIDRDISARSFCHCRFWKTLFCGYPVSCLRPNTKQKQITRDVRALTANTHWSLFCHLFLELFSVCVRACVRACMRTRARARACVCVCSIVRSLPSFVKHSFSKFLWVRILIREYEILNSTIYGFTESAAHSFLIPWSEFSIDGDVYV